jgi:hypothetical protein
MTKLEISAPFFTGAAVLVYNADKLLTSIDLSTTNLTEKQRTNFKNLVPIQLDDVLLAFKNKADVVQVAYTISFEEFWNAYGKKINRKRCEPLWNKLSHSQQLFCVQGIRPYDAFLKRESWRTKADPENYLRNQMWDNEWQ